LSAIEIYQQLTESLAHRSVTNENSTVKTWQIFAIGLVATLALFIASGFLSSYEAAIAAMVAIFVVSVVAFGFITRPRTDVFYVTTTIPRVIDGQFCIEHDCIAVRLEVARLWLLFVPTFCAVAFLAVAFARGSIWNFSLVDWFFENVAIAYVLGELVLVLLVVVLSNWVSERWVLRDAAASSAASVSTRGAWVSYSFLDPKNEYYGGVGVALGIHQPPELATLVLYDSFKPQLNKIGMTLLFHRLVIIGRGVTELDGAKNAVQVVVKQAAQ
jgi:hypothetical protein